VWIRPHNACRESKAPVWIQKASLRAAVIATRASGLIALLASMEV